MEIAFELEEKFDLKIPDEALYEAKTVKNIVDYIASQKGALNIIPKGSNKNMAVKFSVNFKNLFKPAVKADLPDNGFELPGQNGRSHHSHPWHDGDSS